ncbi:tetratricopeptide repeat-containing sulfotransferase family protein [Microbulbifer magnicolonia]|uniref:tetratricopeptide repeat-containing sulfotransferase family protein n=1 Tax=Microbulbifer magnicolonia TaxID=3109744 RepID=UPI002B40CE55|nr:tetratricopeptide repeat protein [Microbulbifer sp. GG15]
MRFSPEFLNRLREARTLVAQNRFSEAEVLYQELLSTGEGREGLLRELFQLYMQLKRPADAIACLERLAQVVPAKPEYWLHMAELAQSVGNFAKAISAYRAFLRKVPDRPNIIFNFAHLLKRAGFPEEALERYRAALQKNISVQEEVYTNIGVIYSELRREREARQSFEKALELNEKYIPAIINLAGLLEESGDRSSASDYYRRALALDDSCYLALCRLAHLRRAQSEDDPLIEQISSLVARKDLSTADLEELNFALGKLLDDCGNYDRAFSSYEVANKLGALRFAPYDRARHTKSIDDLIQFFSRDWFAIKHSALTEAPVFICGMFRSGSTLVEQILSGHSGITAGGELEFFPQLIRDLHKRYPHVLAERQIQYFEQIGGEYLNFLEKRFPSGMLVTDKRPDNFLHVGLIKSVLPKARFIWTRRGLLDNCLSVYFQQLGGEMNYSVDLDSIGHYYTQQVRLMRHWKSLFPDSVFEFSYEQLVANSEVEVRRLLEFLELPWEAACLDFSSRVNYVKTASIWQVRESIHQKSAARHKCYEPYLKVLEKYLSD